MKENTHRKFTQAEDQLLVTYVRKYGEKNWKTIAKMMDGRTPRQCRERFKYYLSTPLMNVSNWSQEEDALLLQKYQEMGSKWSQIALFFPGRTDINIKNRFNRIMRTYKRNNIALPLRQIPSKKIDRNIISTESSSTEFPVSIEENENTHVMTNGRIYLKFPVPISLLSF